jgi:hypothetical protein
MKIRLSTSRGGASSSETIRLTPVVGYQVISVELRDGRTFEQVVTSEGCIIEVHGYKEIPFAPDEVASITVNHRRWNFRDLSYARSKAKAAKA